MNLIELIENHITQEVDELPIDIDPAYAVGEICECHFSAFSVDGNPDLDDLDSWEFMEMDPYHSYEFVHAKH